MDRAARLQEKRVQPDVLELAGGKRSTVEGNRIVAMRRARKANSGVISAMIFVGVAMGALAMMITIVAR